MDQIQTLSSAVQSAVSGNTLYTDYKQQWEFYLESYIGGEEYRNAGHLIRYQLETQNEYNARLAQTPLDNHAAAVVSVFNSFLFREEPERELGVLEKYPEVNGFLEDADLDGRSLNAFMKDVATWASVFGHCWILAVKPNVGAQTRAEELALGVRPYVSYLTPLTVLDWEWKRNAIGRYELDYFKYIEEVTGNVQVIKEWTKTSITTTVVDVENDAIDNETFEVNPLGKIPAVCVYNKKGVVRGIGVSDIADISMQQKFLYNCASEIQQSISMDTHPSLVATPETNVGTGSGALIHMPENIDPGLKPYLLEFSGAGVDKILNAMNHSIDSIDKMANIGSIRGTEAKRMSGVAQRQEFELLAARLSEKADNIELAEEQVWELFSQYMGLPWQGKIEYPGSFNISDTSDEIAQLKMAADTVGDSVAARQAITQEVMSWLGYDFEPGEVNAPEAKAEFEPHMMFNVLTGESKQVESQEEHEALAAQGWKHEGEY
tara:strand:- start:284 stop:1756 length:1473 start_codon:yes stop_codon:yes gene_type:complete